MKRQHIIFSNYDDIDNPMYGGGGAWAVYEVSRRLAKHFEITIITGAHGNGGPKERDGIRYIRVGIPFFPSIVNQFLFPLLLPFFAITQRFDLWFESFTPPFTTAFLPLFTRKPVVGIAHFLNAEEKARQYHVPFTPIESLGLKLYTDVIVLNPKQAEKIATINPQARTYLMRNGTTLRPSRVASKRKPYLLFLGRIEIDQKGLDMLLSAFASAQKNVRKLRLVIAGSGSDQDEQRLQDLIAENNLGSLTTCPGRVEGKEKVALLKEALAVVFPSRYEGQSITAIESIVSGTPVLAFDIDGFSWLSDKEAVKVPSFDIPEFSQAIVRIAKDKKLARALRERYLRLSPEFSWDKIAKKYEGIARERIGAE